MQNIEMLLSAYTKDAAAFLSSGMFNDKGKEGL